MVQLFQRPSTVLHGADQAGLFANRRKHLAIEDGKLRVSSLLKWYGSDFDALGGVADYLISLTDPERRSDEAEVDSRLANSFGSAIYRYDWTVNDVRFSRK